MRNCVLLSVRSVKSFLSSPFVSFPLFSHSSVPSFVSSTPSPLVRYSSSPVSTELLPLPGTLPPRARKRMQKVYELCITNAGNYVKPNQIHRLLKENGIQFLEVDKRTQEVAGFVRFGTIEDMNHAYKIIPTIKFKERIWSVGPVTGNRIKRTENEIDTLIRKYYNQHLNPNYTKPVHNHQSKKNNPDNNHNNARPTKRRPVYDEEGQLISTYASHVDDEESSPSSSVDPSSSQNLLNAILPWHNVPYEEQLRRKQADMQDVMRSMTEKIIQVAQRNADKKYAAHNGKKNISNNLGQKRKFTDISNPSSNDPSSIGKPENVSTDTSSLSSSTATTFSSSSSTLPASPYPSTVEEFLPVWFKSARIQPNDPVCTLYPILPAPEAKYYRNKAQYTIGYDANNEPCVGFCLGSFQNTAGAVEKGTEAFNIPPAIHQIADKVQQFIETSPLPPYNSNIYVGVWRQLTVRWSRHGSNNTDEYMIDLMTSPPSMTTAEVIENFENDKNKNMEEFLRKHALLLKEQIESRNGDTSGSTGTSNDSKNNNNENNLTATTLVGASSSSTLDDIVSMIPDASSSSSSSSTAEATTITGNNTATNEATTDNADKDTAAADEAYKAEQLQIYKQELERFVEHMKSSSGSSSSTPSPNITSIFLQEYNGVSHPSTNHPHILLYGNGYIRERMCDLSFDISPGAFFQVNTPIAEKLYYLARMFALEGKSGADKMLVPSSLSLSNSINPTADLSSLTSSSLPVSHFQNISPVHRPSVGIIDVCCGTGTIGLICSSNVGKVIGVELSQEAINDANRNTVLNNITNTKFICNKAESVMKDILNIVQEPVMTTGGSTTAADSSNSTASVNPSPSSPSIKEIVAIVDPPRNGLHMDVVKALRTCKHIRRIIYVSCNPSGSLIDDTVRLCIPQEDTNSTPARGPEFHPVLALPVDMFPYTPHCEMIMIFERTQKHLPNE